MKNLKNTIDSGDPGDETLKRYRFQITYAAIKSLSMLEEDHVVQEVYCEHHEDILLRLKNSKYIGIQVKTKNLELGPFESNEPAVIKSIVRFVKLDTAFPELFERFIFASNTPFSKKKNSKGLAFIIDSLKEDISEPIKPITKWIERIAIGSQSSHDRVKMTLSKTFLESNISSLEGINEALIEQISNVSKRLGNASHSKLKEIADKLILHHFKAASLEYKDPKYNFFILKDKPENEKANEIIKGKSIDKYQVMKIIDSIINSSPLFLDKPFKQDVTLNLSDNIQKLLDNYLKVKISNSLISPNDPILKNALIQFEKEFRKSEPKKLIANEVATLLKSRRSLINLRNNSLVPKPESQYVPRHTIVKNILNKLISEDSVVVTGMGGMGGIGKTTIVKQICYYISQTWSHPIRVPKKIRKLLFKPTFPGGILFITFLREESLESIIQSQIIRQLGIIKSQSEAIYTLKEIINKIYNEKILVVLDSAEQHPDNFEIIYRAFHSVFPILVTSRRAFGFIDNFENVEKMEEDQAVKLWKRHYLRGKEEINETELQVLKKLLFEIGYLPISIRILAKNAKADNLSLEKFYEEYEENKEKISYYKIVDFKEDIEGTGYEARHDNAYYCIWLSYNNLSEEEKEIFMRCSPMYFAFSDKYILNLSSVTNKRKTIKILNRLSRLSLIEKERKTATYKLHPLARAFAIHHAKEKEIYEEINTEAIETFIQQETSLDENEMRQLMKFSVKLGKAGDYKRLLQLNEKYNNLLDMAGHWARKIDLNTIVLKSVPDNEIDKLEKLKVLFNYADTRERQGYEDVLSNFEELTKDESVESYFYYQYRKWSIYRTQQLKSHEEIIYGCNSIIRRIITSEGKETRILLDIAHMLQILYCISSMNFQNDRFSNELLIFKLIINSKTNSNINFFRTIGDYISTLIRREEHQHAKQINDIFLQSNEIINSYLAHEDYISLIKKEIELNLLNSNYEKAEKTLELYEANINKLNLKDSITDIFQAKGRIALYGNQDYTSAISFFTLISDEKGLNSFWCGVAQYSIDEFLLSKSNFQSAIKKFKKFKNFKYLANSYFYLAKIFDKEKNYTEAIENLARAYKIMQVLGQNDMSDLELMKANLQTKSNVSLELAIDKLRINEDLLPKERWEQKLPKYVLDKNGKRMVLIRGGIVYSGEGRNPIPNLKYYLANLIEIFKSNELLSKQSKLKFNTSFYIDEFPVTIKEYLKYLKSQPVEEKEMFLRNLNAKLKDLDLSSSIDFINYDMATKYIESNECKEMPCLLDFEMIFRLDNRIKQFEDYDWKNENKNQIIHL